MSEEEFEREGRSWHRLAGLDRRDAIARACRGSGDPAALAWLAEGLRLGAGSRVVDIGGGLGGPSAWLVDRYAARPVCTDPVADLSLGARRLFGLPAVVADGGALPFADDAFDAALLLGVLSVVDDQAAVLAEAARLAPSVGAITYLATGEEPLDVGGSTFVPEPILADWLRAAGLRPVAGPASPGLPPPPGWEDEDQPDDPAEDDVVSAIEAGRIAPAVLLARR